MSEVSSLKQGTYQCKLHINLKNKPKLLTKSFCKRNSGFCVTIKIAILLYDVDTNLVQVEVSPTVTGTGADLLIMINRNVGVA